MQEVDITQCDSNLEKLLFDVLGSRSGCQVRQLRIDVQRGRCVLHGTASSFYVKQFVQSIVLRAHPDVRLVNEFTVCPME